MNKEWRMMNKKLGFGIWELGIGNWEVYLFFRVLLRMII
jgi:hypothetical protein